jgi:flagellar FliL protein
MDEGAADSRKSASKRLHKKWVLAAGAALVLLVAAGAGRRLFRHSASRVPEKAKAESAVKTVIHLDPFVVNLADPDGDRFLRVGIDLGLRRDLSENGHAEQKLLPTARTRDTILMILTACNADALLAPAGKAKLKQELTKALREQVPELGVEEVYFTEFLTTVAEMEANHTEASTDRSLGEEGKWSHVKGLPCRLTVEVPVPELTVARLLDLAPGAILDTDYEEGSQVPVLVNGEMIAWGEFDVLEESLAIPLTELA